MSVEFSPEAKAEFDDLISRYPQRRAALLPVLHLAQREFGFISPEVEDYIAGLIQLSPTKVREVVSFYTLFRTKPRGKHLIRFCQNISCHLLGSEDLLAYLRHRLALKGDGHDQTTSDGLVTVEAVECLGACELAPVMQVDDEYVGPLTEALIDETLGWLRGVEGPASACNETLGSQHDERLEDGQTR